MGLPPIHRPKFSAWEAELLIDPDRMELLGLAYDDDGDDDSWEKEFGPRKPNVRVLPEERFNGFLVRSRVLIPKFTAKRIGTGLADAVMGYDGGSALCFDGEWGVRVEKGNDWLQLAICFGCHNYTVTSSWNAQEEMRAIGGGPRWLLRKTYYWYRLANVLRLT
ncbi:hypothetical protein [Limnoglobus roseus]|uniref:Uncharacterized protein n=1 Tax=Limnoglobus roseus TaxID=2598579 RepID=A0A5C1ACR2_9BACT|nr:hypothetical protein [Limnoglobus roseus]QEL17081.1 hypothetical protein PX52LOC_04057 [Limnoglobus roseus]